MTRNAAGKVSSSMQQRIDGELNELGQQQTFEVVSVREPTLPGSSQPERVAFSQQVEEMRRAVNGTLHTVLGLGVGAQTTTGQNLAVGRDATAEQLHVLVVDVLATADVVVSALLQKCHSVFSFVLFSLC